MKKNLLAKIWFGTTTALLNLPVAAFAQVPQAPAPIVTDYIGLTCLFSKIINLLFAALIGLTVFFVVMAAYKYLTSGGDPEKVKEASQQLLYAAIAVVIGLLAKGVPSIVASIVGGSASLACPNPV